MAALPTVMTHNYHRDDFFLSNLCDLPVGEAEAIVQRQREDGLRVSKANYLSRRVATEEWLIGERKRLLGVTHLMRPIYFFLGDFADGRDPLRPCSVLMPLEVFPSDVLTFTYQDSMASFSAANGGNQQCDGGSLCGKVLSLREITEVVEEFGLPDADRQSGPLTRGNRFVEVQVWDDRPIRKFLGARRVSKASSNRICKKARL